MPSVKPGGIKYHFLSLWYDSTWYWTPVPRIISEHSTHKGNGSEWRKNCLGLFYVLRIKNQIHWTFIFTFFAYLFIKNFFDFFFSTRSHRIQIRISFMEIYLIHKLEFNRYYHSGTEWTREKWKWRSILQSPNLPNWSLTIRFSLVLYSGHLFKEGRAHLLGIQSAYCNPTPVTAI